MKVVVDTNIIFSALLNSNGTIGDLLFNSEKHFEFYSCNYMRLEIQIHWKRLRSISKLSEKQLQISYSLILSRLNFVSEELIPENVWKRSEALTAKIDIDDTDFVALTTYLKATLWTGDKVLCDGLKKSGFKKIVNTSELLAIRNASDKG